MFFSPVPSTHIVIFDLNLRVLVPLTNATQWKSWWQGNCVYQMLHIFLLLLFSALRVYSLSLLTRGVSCHDDRITTQNPVYLCFETLRDCRLFWYSPYPPISGMDCRIFKVCTWSFCMRTHMRDLGECEKVFEGSGHPSLCWLCSVIMLRLGFPQWRLLLCATDTLQTSVLLLVAMVSVSEVHWPLWCCVLCSVGDSHGGTGHLVVMVVPGCSFNNTAKILVQRDCSKCIHAHTGTCTHNYTLYTVYDQLK